MVTHGLVFGFNDEDPCGDGLDNYLAGEGQCCEIEVRQQSAEM